MQKDNQWKNKVQEIFQVCHDELRKTTEIGKKMILASKTNSSLHESYEELGHLVLKALKKNELRWDNQRVQDLILKIENCEKELESIEKEVKKIKVAPGPQDISKEEDTKDSKGKN